MEFAYPNAGAKQKEKKKENKEEDILKIYTTEVQIHLPL